MKYFLLTLGILAFIILTCIMLYTRVTLTRPINFTLKQFNENLNIGILVQDLQTGKTLYARNADRLYAPASTQKLFTAWAALHYLTPEFTYKTKLKLDHENIHNGVLNDNIYLEFAGDPTFTHAQLEEIVASLAKTGIHEIKGKLIVNDTAFDTVPMSPGMSWDDAETQYGSPVHAIIIDHNLVHGVINPGIHAGLPATLELPDYIQSLFFKNTATTQAPNSNCELHVAKENNNVVVTGCISENSAKKNIAMAITQPRENLELLLTALLKKYHIHLHHGVEYGDIPATIPTFRIISSPPLALIITDMLKHSNNIIANSLYKTLGAHYEKSQGTWQNGQKAIYHFIATTLPSPATELAFIDGAGTSRYAAHSPTQLAALLKQIYASPYRDFFFSALPIAGVDGTLKERLQTKETHGQFFAKTGTMTGVSALAGFMINAHHQLAFSIAINSFGSDEKDYKNLEDAICMAMAKSFLS